MPTEQKSPERMSLPVPRGMIAWKDVFEMYETGEIDAEQASKLLQEIRQREWSEFEVKLKGQS